MRRATLATVAFCALSFPGAALADLADETALAERYAPVVRLVAQAQECGYGESYTPIDLEVLFAEPTVALRGPWGPDLVKIGPAAADLSAERFEYHLDFPGNPLQPGCGYERWGQRVTKGTPPTVYAHVAAEPRRPGKLSLQYWFYYVFNDWNNTHEGDWEMIQLVFDAADAKEALGRRPAIVGYSQHEGAEQAGWGDDKLELVGGTHPVVYPAAGSHANFYESALFLGSSAAEGVGCDDTTGPSRQLRPTVQTVPSAPAPAQERFPWIAFEGRWGELQPSIFNGPTGPNLKSQWTKPIEWSEGWRERSIAVPGAGALGTGATDFFCRAIGAGSNALRRAINEPQTLLLVLIGLALLIGFLLTRTSWTPAAPLRLARRRAWGQVLASTARMYFGRLPLFLGIGVLAVPIAVAVTLLQALVFRASEVVGVEVGGERGGLLVAFMVALGTALTLLGLGIVQAVTARALAEIDEGRRVMPWHAFRLALESVRPLLGALVIASVLLAVLFSTVFLLPVGIVLAVRWALIAPVVELEDASATSALRRSGHLVRHEWFKVGSLAVLGAALALIAGPLVGAVLIVLTEIPLGWLNLIAGVVYAIALPFVAITTTYLYFDVLVRDEVTDEASGTLPAEIVVSR